jgi:hypothetical protein
MLPVHETEVIPITFPPRHARRRDIVENETTQNKDAALIGKKGLTRRKFLERLTLASLGATALGGGWIGLTAVAHSGDPAHGGYPDAITHWVMDALNDFIGWLGTSRGYIGEVSIPSNYGPAREPFYPDQKQWRALGERYLTRCDAAGLMITPHQATEMQGSNYYGGYFSSLYICPGNSLVAPDGGYYRVVDRPGYQATLIEAHASVVGLNFQNAQCFDAKKPFSNQNPQTYNTDYWYPADGTNATSPRTGKNSYQYLAARGHTLTRMGFRWERLQPSLYKELSTTELTRMKRSISKAQAAGIKIVLDLHNYGEYRTTSDMVKLNSPSLPISALVDVWKRLSYNFKSHPNVVAYDIMNEPYVNVGIPKGSYATPQAAWESAAQQVVDVIRTSGDQKRIMVPCYAGVAMGVPRYHASPWIRNGGDIMYEAHHYFDHYFGTGTGGGHFKLSYNDENAYRAS